MKYLKVLIPVALVLALGACAKPLRPISTLPAPRLAMRQRPPTSSPTHRTDWLKSAQDKLAQMETELTAKHYDKVKTLALDAKATADNAANDAAKNKAQAQTDATTLIDALKKALPDATQKLAAAKKVKGVKLDFVALTKALTDAKAAVADADNDLAAGTSPARSKGHRRPGPAQRRGEADRRRHSGGDEQEEIILSCMVRRRAARSGSPLFIPARSPSEGSCRSDPAARSTRCLLRGALSLRQSPRASLDPPRRAARPLPR